MGGCTLPQHRVGLPVQQKLVRDQLIIHSNFHLPERHRLVDELTAQRNDIIRTLKIGASDQPIQIYLFKNEDVYHRFMVQTHPLFPNRRAFFVKDEDGLKVFAYWGSKVGEDLRHEVTHGYLHSVLPNVPLWLDEGIAEYFEVGRGKGGYNAPHAVHLWTHYKQGLWKPDLEKLEKIQSASELTQTDYAESWLVVHFLLTGDERSQATIHRYLNQLSENEAPPAFMPIAMEATPDLETQLLLHLEMMAE